MLSEKVCKYHRYYKACFFKKNNENDPNRSHFIFAAFPRAVSVSVTRVNYARAGTILSAQGIWKDNEAWI